MTRDDLRAILGIDGSAGAAQALAFVGQLPLGPRDLVVVAMRPAYVLAARAGDASVASRLAASARRRAQQLVDQAVALLRERGVNVRGDVCDGEDAVDALIRLAERERASLLVVGSRGRGPWTSILLGSTARSLAVTSPVPVLVVRRPSPAVRVLVATDGSAAALAAIAAFARLPRRDDVEVELLAVLPVHEWSDERDDEVLAIRESVEHDEEDRVAARLERERALLPPGVRSRTDVERGHVGTTILERADQIGAGLIVLGTRGSSGPRAPFWGSTAERVLTQAACDVLIVPAPAEGA